jgi:hypothetical protein
MDLNVGQIAWIATAIIAGCAIWYFKGRKRP